MSLDACARAVETGDPDRFAAALAAPPAARVVLWPLYALNLELARAPWASQEPLVAEMRLQWWIDALEALADAGRVPAHPIGAALADLCATHPVPLPALVALAEARRRDCWPDPFEDGQALADYLEATAGNLTWAAAHALGAPAMSEPMVRDHAYASGLANWLRAVPALAALGRAPLPDPRPEALRALAQTGLARLDRARAARKVLPGAAVPALFAGWQARAVLGQVLANPERVHGGALAVSEFRRRAGLARMALTGRW